MKAWRVYGIGDMRLDDVQIPRVKTGWVLAKVRMLQISITEVERFYGVSLYAAESLEKQIKEKGPLQLYGHEFCGDVIEVGKGVANVRVGDRVVYWRRPACHNCGLCLAGYEELCHKGSLLGVEIPGCLAEYVLIPAESIVSVPDSITDSEAAALQPLAGVVADAYGAGIEMGDTVAILGQGVMGLGCMQLSRICGAGKTITVDVRNDVLALSRQLGADIVIDATNTDPVEAVLEATGGKGADVVFECAGGSPRFGLSGTKTLGQAVRIVRDQGKIMQVAILEPGATLEVTQISIKGIRFLGWTFCTPKLMRYTIDLVSSKQIQLAPLVTNMLEGLDRVTDAIEITSNKVKYGAINPPQVMVTH